MVAEVLEASGKVPFRSDRVRKRRALAAVAAASVVVAVPAHADQIVTHWTMPVIALPEAERPAGPDVFGTVALPVRPQPTSTRWSKVMHASLAQPVLDRMAVQAGSFSLEEDVAFVQSAVNSAIHTDPDAADCSDDGYWAPAEETMARGMGDCFDVAVAKMEALRRLGVPDSDLYLTSGWFRNDTPGKGRESVALLVRIGERFWVLPEHSDRAYESVAGDDSAAFTPVVTYGVGMTWIHGRVVQIAALGDVAGATSTTPAAAGPVH